jgi:hypothetical protein
MKTETLSTAVMASPPASYTGLVLIGYPVADWVSTIMLIYAVLLVAAQLPKTAAGIRTIYRRLKTEQSNCR